MKILALDPWYADVRNKTHAGQNNPSVDIEYDENLNCQTTHKNSIILFHQFFSTTLYILGGNLMIFQGLYF